MFIRLKHIIKNLILLRKAKFIFKNPKKKDIIIFDKKASRDLKSALIKYNFIFLANRIDEIKEIYITKEIIYFMYKNFFKNSLKINYLLKLILIINPKILITRTDTSIDFHILSKILHKKIKCIALQQGLRFVNNRILVNDTPKKVLKKYFIPEFYVFSKNDLKQFKLIKAKVKKYFIAGSIKVASALNYLKKKKINKNIKYDFCLISNTGPPCGLLAKYLIDYCNENKYSYVIAAKSDLKDGKEMQYYREFCGNRKINIKENYEKKFSSYLMAIKSKVVIGHASTMIYEMLGLNKKVITFNGIYNYFMNKDIFSKNLHSENKNCKKESFAEFKRMLDKIHKMSYLEYFNLLKKKDFVISNINTIKFLQDRVNFYLKDYKNLK